MGILDSLFGRKDDEKTTQTQNNLGAVANSDTTSDTTRAHRFQNADRPSNADEQALARYRYMLQTAPPEDIEAAHQEAFGRLTPEQRQMVLQQMSQIVPQNEAAHLSDNPRDLARAATRAEMRQPGAMQRMFGGSNSMGGQMGGQPMIGGGVMGGMGGMLAGSLLSSIAGGFIGSSIANSFFDHGSNEQMFQSSPEAQAVDGGIGDYNGGDYADAGYNDANFQPTGLDSSADPYGDPEDRGADTNIQDSGLDSSADPYGDPADTGDSGGFSDTGFDGGGFDSGGFDSGGFDSGGDF